MKRTGKKLLLLFLISVMLFALPACGKKKESDAEPTESPDNPGQKGTPGVTEPSITLPVEIDLPEGTSVREEKGVLFVAETSDYNLYVFDENTVENGAIFDANDVISLVNSKERESLAKDVLRLKEFSISADSKMKAYDNINGMQGYLIPMSHMVYEGSSGDKTEGAGFVVIYGKPDDVGVYIILGIQKANGNGAPDSESGKLAMDTALSMIPKETEPKYVAWEGAMPDETEVRFAYKNGGVLQVVTDGDDLLLPFNESGEAGILIRHLQNRADMAAKDQLQNLMESLKDSDDMAFSEITTAQGRVEYQKVILSYTQGEAKMKEILCLCSDQNGSCWILDLYGTEAEVNAKEEDLKVLLWSLEEE